MLGDAKESVTWHLLFHDKLWMLKPTEVNFMADHFWCSDTNYILILNSHNPLWRPPNDEDAVGKLQATWWLESGRDENERTYTSPFRFAGTTSLSNYSHSRIYSMPGSLDQVSVPARNATSPSSLSMCIPTRHPRTLEVANIVVYDCQWMNGWL